VTLTRESPVNLVKKYMSSESKTSEKSSKKRNRGRPRLADVADIENKLLEVAMREFVNHGYGGASMNNIVKEAGVSKTTLYSRFPSKKDLFTALIVAQAMRLAPSKLLEFEFRPGQPNLSRGLKAYAKFTLEHSLRGELLGINRLLYAESHRFPELRDLAQRRLEMGVERVQQFIEGCARFEGYTVAHSRRVAEAFMMLMRGWQVTSVVVNENVSSREIDEWVDSVVDLFVQDSSHW